SDDFDVDNPLWSSYMGSQGPQCWPTNNCAFDGFEKYCNGRTVPMPFDSNANPIPFIPPPLNPPTCPGYGPSVEAGVTHLRSQLRGMMSWGDGNPGGPLIRL